MVGAHHFFDKNTPVHDFIPIKCYIVLPIKQVKKSDDEKKYPESTTTEILPKYFSFILLNKDICWNTRKTVCDNNDISNRKCMEKHLREIN